MIMVIDDGVARGVPLAISQISLSSLHVESAAMCCLYGSIEDSLPDGAEDVAARVSQQVPLVEAVLETLQWSVSWPSYHIVRMKDAVVRHQPQVEVIVVTGELDLHRLFTGSLAVRDGSLVSGVGPVDWLCGVVKQLVLGDVGTELGLAQDCVERP